jgi:hypothetical protein
VEKWTTPEKQLQYRIAKRDAHYQNIHTRIDRAVDRMQAPLEPSTDSVDLGTGI